ncbi:hypothetical protein M407DRAFT_242504 [Tulasnella calospora MUT 4182]|uniref:Uncharacterized protein n=1 Tax=Tulasnella calospora MUT 4182 TaxID=1051891 RepID=A0A0C3QQD2_9AGAM|nr:hypothetical protein M407DRAFT_242504 [Tulasnella calospora MUT 4182]
MSCMLITETNSRSPFTLYLSVDCRAEYFGLIHCSLASLENISVAFAWIHSP